MSYHVLWDTLTAFSGVWFYSSLVFLAFLWFYEARRPHDATTAETKLQKKGIRRVMYRCAAGAGFVLGIVWLICAYHQQVTSNY